MPYQRIKFYQTGSFAAGNRLLAEDQRSVQSTAGRSNALTCGHRACQGCGEALGARYALDAVNRATGGKLGDGSYEIDYDYCKGCGLCAAECPCGAIEMQPEPT
jgi:Fe-S-cluster-containing hydrogenase component 2